MTEEDALKHYCCSPKRDLCVASKCMAWRWKYRQTNEQPHPMMAISPQWKPIYERTDEGYCGLAGAPQ
jgi:hypothetical protein